MILSTESFRAFFEEGIPFNRFLGIRLEELGAGWARLTLPFREEFIGDPLRPALHGGLVSTLLDTCGGLAVFSTAQEEIRVSTIDMRVDFLRPGGAEPLLAETKVVRAGNRVAVTDGIAYHPDRKDDPVATCKAVYNIKKVRAG
ncbi:MAG: PaaI family thioesterase [Myxococcales bacterium]